MAEHKIIIPVAVRRCLSLFTAINVPLPGASPEMAEQLGTQNAEPNAMWPQIAEPSAGWPQPSKSAGRETHGKAKDLTRPAPGEPLEPQPINDQKPGGDIERDHSAAASRVSRSHRGGSRSHSRSSSRSGGTSVRAEYPKKGKTRIPTHLVSTKVIIDLGYPYIEEGTTIIIQKALGQEHIDELLRLSAKGSSLDPPKTLAVSEQGAEGKKRPQRKTVLDIRNKLEQNIIASAARPRRRSAERPNEENRESNE